MSERRYALPFLPKVDHRDQRVQPQIPPSGYAGAKLESSGVYSQGTSKVADFGGGCATTNSAAAAATLIRELKVDSEASVEARQAAYNCSEFSDSSEKFTLSVEGCAALQNEALPLFRVRIESFGRAPATAVQFRDRFQLCRAVTDALFPRVLAAPGRKQRTGVASKRRRPVGGGRQPASALQNGDRADPGPSVLRRTRQALRNYGLLVGRRLIHRRSLQKESPAL